MAKAIMVQGTMSNAGKSLICTGLCRIFMQEGFRVAPFKSQNMALNSFVTREGLEMGRAQAVQAEAAGREPSVRMNPILLKPMTHMGSQVILNGRVLGNFSASEYFSMKQTLLPDVMTAYTSLAEENDVIVIEGAGSPAEINLKADDFVNMGMAKLAQAPVLLAGDIDRGGVFAQLFGTISLLDPDEQDMIKATIINKFRGDITLLEPGLKQLEALTNKPIAGVLPMMDVDIDDEDSLSQRLDRKIPRHACLDIAVVRLPHLSNFTDFRALEATEQVDVRYIRTPAELGNPDMVILPGTKSTIADLEWMKKCGLADSVKMLAHRGTVVFGICGGYQMLGRKIVDREGVEGGGETDGLNLLPIETTFANEKRCTRITGTVLNCDGPLKNLTGVKLDGYEIHMGESTLDQSGQPLVLLENGQRDGCFCKTVYGSYLHGFFDAQCCRNALLGGLANKKGVEPTFTDFNLWTYKNAQYDQLELYMRAHLDMTLIHRILEEGI